LLIGLFAVANIIYIIILFQKYERLFELNDPGKGGSFYLQSKVVRAREALELELSGGDDPGPDNDGKESAQSASGTKATSSK
jgi:hypothetical protein